MKLLVIQENSRHPANWAFRECFCLQRAFCRCGHEADVWGLGHDNFANKPDLSEYDAIINLENYDETGWVPNLADVHCTKLLWVIDAHVRGMRCYQDIFERGHYHRILQATRDYLDERSIWCPNCVDDEVIRPLSVPLRSRVGFCGHVVNRQELLDRLAARYDFTADIHVLGHDMVRAINSYQVHVNRNISNDVNCRNFETIGCATALVTNTNPQLDDLGFIDGVNCMMYNNFDELYYKVDQLLGDERLRVSIAQRGLELSKRHTYVQRARLIISLIVGIRG